MLNPSEHHSFETLFSERCVNRNTLELNDSLSSSTRNNVVARCLGPSQPPTCLLYVPLVFLTAAGGCATSGSAQEAGLEPPPSTFLRAQTSKEDNVFSRTAAPRTGSGTGVEKEKKLQDEMKFQGRSRI